ITRQNLWHTRGRIIILPSETDDVSVRHEIIHDVFTLQPQDKKRDLALYVHDTLVDEDPELYHHISQAGLLLVSKGSSLKSKIWQVNELTARLLEGDHKADYSLPAPREFNTADKQAWSEHLMQLHREYREHAIHILGNSPHKLREKYHKMGFIWPGE
ncbi:MAG: hypothetical protein ABH851_01220, partial [Methanobacteriota archaeon]